MKIKTLLVLAASGLLSMGLAACGGGGTSSSSVVSSESSSAVSSESSSQSSSESVSSSEAATPKQVTIAKSLGYFQVGEEVDLEEYIAIKMSDGTLSTDYAYTLECASEDLIINGHVITTEVAGQYGITVVAGSAKRKITADFRTKENIDLINFLAQGQENPKNYYAHEYDITDAGELEYVSSVTHTDDYCAWADLTDLGNDHDEETNSIAALLADGYWYWGAFNAEGTPVFEPGKFSPTNYYFYGDFPTTGDLFSTVVDEDGEESLVADASAAKDFYGAAIGYSLNAAYSWDSLAFIGAIYDDAEENIVEALFQPLIKDSKGTVYSTGIFGITGFGEAKVDALETVAEDRTFIPAAIHADEVVAVLESADLAKNYTIDFEMQALDESQEAITAESATLETNIMYLVFGGVIDVKSTLTVTESDMVADFTYTEVADGAASEVNEKIGYKVADEVVTMYALNEAGDAYEETTVEGISTLAETGLGKNYAVASIDKSAVNDVEWNANVYDATEDLYTITSASVGDDDGTTQTNGLFLDFVKYNFLFDLDKWFEPMDGWGDGEMHSLSQCTRGYNISVSKTNNEIDVSVLMYSPFSDADGYIRFNWSISDVGTSQSAYPVPNAAE